MDPMGPFKGLYKGYYESPIPLNLVYFPYIIGTLML